MNILFNIMWIILVVLMCAFRWSYPGVCCSGDFALNDSFTWVNQSDSSWEEQIRTNPPYLMAWGGFLFYMNIMQMIGLPYVVCILVGISCAYIAIKAMPKKPANC